MMRWTTHEGFGTCSYSCRPYGANGSSVILVLQTCHPYGVQMAAGCPDLRPSPVRRDMVVERTAPAFNFLRSPAFSKLLR